MSVNINVHGNTGPLERDVQAAVSRINRAGGLKISVDDKGVTQPLGNMKRSADEFSKSLEASNARVLAFGASVGIINAVSNAFKQMVVQTVQVEKSLTDINVVMGLTSKQLDKFGSGLFTVAAETGAGFKAASEAATEFARQGLSVNETLKRTKDALILTRLTGMKATESVKSLTAAMNTFKGEISDSTNLVSKFAAVDVKFAVSAEDFAQAIARSGAAARDAGVDINQLIGIVTAVQERTARGGAVIGNAFKTIFTRLQRSSTLKELENIGVAVRDLEGKTLPAMQILNSLAGTYDKLTDAQRSYISQNVAGVFQINMLKAAMSDLGQANNVTAQASAIAASATDESNKKNEQLRQTMSALASETGVALQQVAKQVGELALAPGINKILDTIKGLSEGLTGVLGDGENEGNKFAKGLLAGFGNFLTGPGLVMITAVIAKLFVNAAKYASSSLTSLLNINKVAQQRKGIEQNLMMVLAQNTALQEEMLRNDISRADKEKIILNIIKQQTIEAQKLSNISKSMAPGLMGAGVGSGLGYRPPKRTRAFGFVPNFAVEDEERRGARQGGYAPGAIKTMNIPGQGPVVYNSAEEVKQFKGMRQPAIIPPSSSKAGKMYKEEFSQAHGFDPYASQGYIPNFSKMALNSRINKFFTGGGRLTQNNSATDNFREAWSNDPSTRGLDFNRANIESYIQKNSGNFLGAKSIVDFQNKAEKEKKVGKLPHVNPGGGRFVVLTAQEGPDKFKTLFAPSNPKDKKDYMSFPQKKSKFRVDVPMYGLGPNDEGRMRAKEAPNLVQDLREVMTAKAIEFASSFGVNILPVDKKNVEKSLNSGSVSSAAGSVFESGIATLMDEVKEESGGALMENYLARTDISSIDLPYAPKLYDLYGVKAGQGQAGAEAKISMSEANIKSSAKKFFDVLQGGKLAFDYASDAKNFKGGAYVAPKTRFSRRYKDGTADGGSTFDEMQQGAGGYIPNFSLMTVEEREALRKANTKDAENRIKKFGNSSFSIGDGFYNDTPLIRVADSKTGSYTDFAYAKEYGERSPQTSIIYSSRAKGVGIDDPNAKGGAFRNFGLINDFTSKQGRNKSIYSDFDQVRGAAGKTPWAMLLHAFPQLKQRIRPGMQTSGMFNIGMDELEFNSLKGLKTKVNRWVKTHGLESFTNYASGNLGLNEKVGILGGTGSGELFSLSALRSIILNRKDKRYLNDSKVKFAAGGYVPGFSNPLTDAIDREKGSGVPVSKIRVGRHSALIGKSNPMGLGVTNTDDEPNGLRDVFGATGHVPNYALKEFVEGFQMNEAERDSLFQSREEYKKTIETANKEQKDLTKEKQRLEEALKRQTKGSNNYNRTQKKLHATSQKLTASRDAAAQTERRLTATSRAATGASARSRMVGGNMGMMAMMGLPMLGGQLQQSGPTSGDTVAGINSYALGGAANEAATGAMMGTMLTPLVAMIPGIGALIAPFTPVITGAIASFMGFNSAVDEVSKALAKEKFDKLQNSIKAFDDQLRSTVQSLVLTKEFAASVESINTQPNPNNLEESLSNTGRLNLSEMSPKERSLAQQGVSSGLMSLTDNTGAMEELKKYGLTRAFSARGTEETKLLGGLEKTDTTSIAAYALKFKDNSLARFGQDRDFGSRHSLTESDTMEFIPGIKKMLADGILPEEEVIRDDKTEKIVGAKKGVSLRAMLESDAEGLKQFIEHFKDHFAKTGTTLSDFRANLDARSFKEMIEEMNKSFGVGLGTEIGNFEDQLRTASNALKFAEDKLGGMEDGSEDKRDLEQKVNQLKRTQLNQMKKIISSMSSEEITIKGVVHQRKDLLQSLKDLGGKPQKVIQNLMNISSRGIYEYIQTIDGVASQREAVIKQLNMQMVQVQIQGSINDEMFKIKEKYTLMGALLDGFSKQFGDSIGPMAEANLDYSKGIMKIRQDLETSNKKTEQDFKKGLLDKLKQDGFSTELKGMFQGQSAQVLKKEGYSDTFSESMGSALSFNKNDEIDRRIKSAINSFEQNIPDSYLKGVQDPDNVKTASIAREVFKLGPKTVSEQRQAYTSLGEGADAPPKLKALLSEFEKIEKDVNSKPAIISLTDAMKNANSGDLDKIIKRIDAILSDGSGEGSQLRQLVDVLEAQRNLGLKENSAQFDLAVKNLKIEDQITQAIAKRQHAFNKIESSIKNINQEQIRGSKVAENSTKVSRMLQDNGLDRRGAGTIERTQIETERLDEDLIKTQADIRDEGARKMAEEIKNLEKIGVKTKGLEKKIKAALEGDAPDIEMQKIFNGLNLSSGAQIKQLIKEERESLKGLDIGFKEEKIFSKQQRKFNKGVTRQDFVKKFKGEDGGVEQAAKVFDTLRQEQIIQENIDRLLKTQTMSEEERKRLLEEIKGSVNDMGANVEMQLKNEESINSALKERASLKMPQGYSASVGQTMNSLQTEIDFFGDKMGSTIPMAFRDGMVGAMNALTHEADSFGEAMLNVANQFLNTINQALFQHTANKITVGLFGNGEYTGGPIIKRNSGGPIGGGDIPAMVSNGEYLMNKESVAKYGPSMMHKLNQGEEPKKHFLGTMITAGATTYASYKMNEMMRDEPEEWKEREDDHFQNNPAYKKYKMSGSFMRNDRRVQEEARKIEQERQKELNKFIEKKRKENELGRNIVTAVGQAGLNALGDKLEESGAFAAADQAVGWNKARRAGANSAIKSNQSKIESINGDADIEPDVKKSKISKINAKIKSLENITESLDLEGKSSWWDPGHFAKNKTEMQERRQAARKEQKQKAEDAFFKRMEDRYPMLKGRPVNKFSGGAISGTPGIDKIPAMLTEGEYVINANATRKIGRSTLDKINAGKYNQGGMVGDKTGVKEEGENKKGSSASNINITVNVNNTKGTSTESKSSSSDDKGAEEMAAKIKQQVVTTIQEENRPGGLLG